MTNDTLNRSYKFLEDVYIKKVCDMWLGEIYEYSPQHGEGIIERYMLEPGIELRVYRDCTHERLAESLPYHHENMIEIISLSKGEIYVRYNSSDEWMRCDNKQLIYFSWSKPITYYDFRCKEADGIGLYLDMDLLTNGASTNHSWLQLLNRLFKMNERVFARKSSPIHRSITKQLTVQYEESLMNHFLLKSKALEFLSHCVNNTIGIEVAHCPDSRVRKIKKKIDSSYHLPLQVNRLAEEFGIPTIVLQKQFKQYYGYTVYHYIQKRRMDAAMEALLNTDQSVLDIAMEVGYDNPSKFAAVFKRNFNETPLNYRKKYRQSFH
ncbi:helix-turn-helix transcriptional regulator [Bacillus altitudinis]|uniref:AraC family transcriptional regulator n=1 Tax=Bacillus altitudinis TaxID=293387 RepID=UPI003CF9D1DB